MTWTLPSPVKTKLIRIMNKSPRGAIVAPRDFICLPSTHINRNCDILACSTMATPYVNTVCYEPNTGANQHKCEQQSNRTELRSEKFLYEKIQTIRPRTFSDPADLTQSFAQSVQLWLIQTQSL